MARVERIQKARKDQGQCESAPADDPLQLFFTVLWDSYSRAQADIELFAKTVLMDPTYALTFKAEPAVVGRATQDLVLYVTSWFDFMEHQEAKHRATALTADDWKYIPVSFERFLDAVGSSDSRTQLALLAVDCVVDEVSRRLDPPTCSSSSAGSNMAEVWSFGVRARFVSSGFAGRTSFSAASLKAAITKD